MPKEIERKFLVKGNKWRRLAKGIFYRQGYLSTDIERTVRVRLIGEQGFITIKGKTSGATRNEFEYQIPLADAELMLKELCKRPIIEKERFKITHGDLIWEVDEFWGQNKGLIVAEVELSDENQTIDVPDWIGEEVTTDAKYLNVNLVKAPFNTWR
jgi:CYTH domain-containing protein